MRRVAPLNVSGRVYSITMNKEAKKALALAKKYAKAGIPLTNAEKNLIKYLITK